MTHPLKRLEENLERWFEGSIARMLGPNIPASSLASHLAESMEAGLRQSEQRIVHAPDHYVIMLNPGSMTELKDQLSQITEDLSTVLHQVAFDQGYFLTKVPEISFEADPSIAEWDIRVKSWHSTRPLEETQGLVLELPKEPPKIPRGAFLIVEGERHFPLDQPITNIGRRKDNHLVIQDPLVSRSHAQIRVRNGRFIIFDLGSKSGTCIQGVLIKQHILQPGDVIMLANTYLVYGEDIEYVDAETTSITPLEPSDDP
ncbi:MAG: DUF3662 domain-containing protein [Anaerolineales bacterium]|nr:DUF3662 domain-containing protein [Anaerolineales bacterium]